jgi:hypothetical protein
VGRIEPAAGAISKTRKKLGVRSTRVRGVAARDRSRENSQERRGETVNTKTLANHYSQLTPEELFRLIMAANARGDEAERDRLANAGQRITLSMSAQSPYARAFEEFSFATYIELLEEAANFLDEHQRARNAVAGAKIPIRRRMRMTKPSAEQRAAEKAADDADKQPLWTQSDLVNALGFQFKARLIGWKFFCERWNADPTALWDAGDFPGLDRLGRTCGLIRSGLAFPTPADLARWLNTVRPFGDPELTEANIATAEQIADSLDAEFRERVRWWGG